MQIFRTFEAIASKFEKVCLAIGVFDGVHLGHQRVIFQARDDAKLIGGHSVVLTFDPHPMQVLCPEKAPPLLTSTRHKLALIEGLGVDACLILTFDKPFAETSATEFLRQLVHTCGGLAELCVGTRFRFGHNREGDVRLMENFALQNGFKVREIKPVRVNDEMVSSTSIRQRILQGQLDRAAAMLGRPYSVSGKVEPGDHRGHKIGFPTANVDPNGEVLPPDGVYAVRVAIDKRRLGGVANIGVRPTFSGSSQGRMLEVHILDFNGDIYGAEIGLEFVENLRPERRFDSVSSLQQQIRNDIQGARRILSVA